MAVSKQGSILQSGTSVAPGGSAVSNVLDVQTAVEATITCQVENGSTGPTVGMQVFLEFSTDGSQWYPGGIQVAGVANSGKYAMVFDVPPGVGRARLTANGNTGQNVLFSAQAHVLLSL